LLLDGNTCTSRRLAQFLFQSGQAGREGPLLFFGLFSLVLDAQTVSLPKCLDGRVQDKSFALLLGRQNVREKCKSRAHVYDVTVQVCFSLPQFVKLLVDAKQLQFGFSHTGQEAITMFVALIFLKQHLFQNKDKNRVDSVVTLKVLATDKKLCCNVTL
jgi:hypothetical protein